MNNKTLEIAYAVPLNQSFHRTALKFAKEQNTTAKGKQVYLNTLAVLAVNDFVQWLHMETDLESADSWNIVVRLFQNVADLVLPNLGTIECIPVILSENQTVISIPPEVQEDRIAYVFVGFEEKLDQCYLMGFYPTIPNNDNLSEIALEKLQPIEELIDYLSEIEIYDNILKLIDEKIKNYRDEIIRMLEKCRNLPPFKQRTFLINNFSELSGEKSSTTKLPALLTLKNTTNVNDNTEEDKWINLVDELLPKLKEIWGQ